MYIYVVEMCRWGSRENHSYSAGVYTSLVAALRAAIKHAEYRARKYEPFITMQQMENQGCNNIICRDLEEAQELLKQIRPARKSRKNETKAI